MAWRIEYDAIVLALLGFNPGRKIWLDPARGSDGNDGSMGSAVKTLACAYSMARTGRNDVIFFVPGATAINLKAEFAWAKNQTHLVGLGGPVGFTDYTMSGSMIYTDTITVANTLTVTGSGCQFHNIYVANNGANAACLGALKLAAPNCRFYGCAFSGIMNSTQAAVLAARSVLIASLSTDYYFENCVIGNNCWAARTQAYQGHVYYGGTTESGLGAGNGPQNGRWKNCKFLSIGTTVTVPMIRVGGSATQTPAGNEAMDRIHFFENCEFDNWYGAGTTPLTSAFDDACLSWHEVRIKDCALHGYDQWRAVRSSQTANNLGLYRINMGLAVAAHGGESLEPTS